MGSWKMPPPCRKGKRMQAKRSKKKKHKKIKIQTVRGRGARFALHAANILLHATSDCTQKRMSI